MFLKLIRLLVTTEALLLLVSGCATVHDPYLTAEQIAGSNGWHKKIIGTDRFDLLTYHRLHTGDNELTIYIEGDGNAWRTRYSLSSDPTPITPMVLQLAILDPSPNLVYLARPCQYVLKDGHGRNCTSQYWASGRFAPEIIEALDEAVTHLKKETGASRIHLIGYSGGGGLALLVASNRDDVASLRTIAGNLDHAEFTGRLKVSPLTASLNPVDFAAEVSSIPQIHFSGEKDRTVPQSIAEKFLTKLPEKNCASVIPVRGVSHSKGWQEVWPDLLQMTPSCF